ncbi:MAG: hypothetical protein ABI833_16055 [Acidobacteriota bacterium]
MPEWKPSTGSITLFLASPTSPPLSALDLYRQIWKLDPDKFEKQPNPLAPAIAQGRHSGLTAACAIQPGRIDFRLSPILPPRQGIGIVFPLIEDLARFERALDGVTATIGQGVIAHPVVRVALNLHFLVLKSSFAEANRALAAIIPPEYGVKLSDEEDFVFQINRPFASLEAPNVKMNFLTKWSVDRFQVLTLPVGGVTPVSPTITTLLGSRVAFDVNSIPDPQALGLSSSQQSSILREALITAGKKQKGLGLRVDE